MIIVDLETTGLDPLRCAIIEIGAVDFENPRVQFNASCRIWEGAEVHPDALAWNGNTMEDITDAGRKSLHTILLEFIDWMKAIKDRTLAGHNVDFDLGFLNASARRYNVDFDFGKRKIDQHALVYAHMLKRGLSPPVNEGVSDIHSDCVMEYVGIPPEPKPHCAIHGAIYETEAISRLILGEGKFEMFNGHAIPPYLNQDHP